MQAKQSTDVAGMYNISRVARHDEEKQRTEGGRPSLIRIFHALARSSRNEPARAPQVSSSSSSSFLNLETLSLCCCLFHSFLFLKVAPLFTFI
jgi:hypothetical protein